MGKRGRPPKPTALKKLQGTYRPDRAARNEWLPPPGAPPRPDWLSDGAVGLWDRLAPVLVQAGVLTTVDGEPFANYCETQALVARLQRLANKGARVTPDGQVVGRALAEAKKLARVLGSEFGLSPSSRSKLDVPREARVDQVEDEFFGPLTVVEGGTA